ncbi:MAG: amidohydrolase family protein [Armatimonadota bacterium]
MDATSIVLTAAWLWDGTDRPPIKNGVVIIAGDRVAAAGERGTVAVPAGPGVQTLEFPDATILPGLIDPHVHLIWPGDGRPADIYTRAATDADLLLQAVKNARAALRAGVTTLRDVGSRGRIALDLHDAIARGDAIGPRILAAGPPITITGGHMHYLGGEADTADEVRRVARRHWRMGADFLKMVVNGGGTPRTHSWIPAYSVEEIAAAVAEARDHETHITVHANDTEAIRRAVAAGVNGIEHCTFLRGPDDIEFDPRLSEEIARRGIHVAPTLGVGYSGVRHAREHWDDLGADERRRWDARFRAWDIRLEVCGQMARQGVRLVTSSDAGWAHHPFGQYAMGMELLAQTGMPSIQILASGTRAAAESIGLGHLLGILEPEKVADILVVAGDPTQRISDLWKVKAVLRSGRVLVEDGYLVA